MTARGEHLCVVDGCPVLLPPIHPMCLSHWDRVPIQIRKRVRATYQEGEPSQEYLRAVLDAVEAVRTKPADTWHNCPISGCGRRIPSRVVVCRFCWGVLPGPLRREVSWLRPSPGYQPEPDLVAAVLAEASRVVQEARAARGSGAGS